MNEEGLPGSDNERPLLLP